MEEKQSQVNGQSANLRVWSALLIILSLAGSFPFPIHAQEPAPSRQVRKLDRAELHQALLDLTSPWTVMCVAAHPDDEDGTTLTMLRRKYGIHTVSLFSTYGEGGQNAVGPELYQELGVIRALETMAASEIQGSEPYFLGLSDFGFSKSAEETFRVWGEKEALRRMVLKIRQLRPDVIITNHNTVSGHGQHQATGRLLLQAFDAAADPNSFPEQLGPLTVWQPQRLFVRFGFESNPETKALEEQAEKSGKVVIVDPNEKDPVRDTSFAEQALLALQRHATQGPWPKSVAERLRAQNRTELPTIRYRLAKEIPSAPALPANAKNFVEGLRLPVATGAKLAPPAINGRLLSDLMDNGDEALVALIRARKAGLFSAPTEIMQLDRPRFELMSRRLDRALAVASGTSLTLSANDSALVPGVESRFTTTAGNSGDADIEVKRLTFMDWSVSQPIEVAEKLPPGTDTSVIIKSTTPLTSSPTIPASEHLYDGRFLGARPSVTAEFELEGARFSITAESRIPVAPIVEIKNISLAPSLWGIHDAKLHPTLSVTLTNHLPSEFRGTLRADNENYFAGSTVEIVLAAGETRTFTIQDKAIPQPSARDRVGVKTRGRRPAAHPVQSGLVLVSVEQAGATSPVSKRSVQAIYTNARVARGIQVGFIPSFDETLKKSLEALGVAATELNSNAVQTSDLSHYDTIILDNRGYQAHPELIATNQRLLDYVNQGGTLIVLYHKANEWNPDEKKSRPQLAPYPIILGDERVTEEDAPVRILQPHHPLLTNPNRITLADFQNWIQERGLYYPKEWDKHYNTLLETSDKGEAPLPGGLLVARVGKGNYIYTSMVWYRQLQAGVPGAYRMFANMISYGHRQG
jgi:LmbE family N-acetylglucosaminyl deacetylase